MTRSLLFVTGTRADFGKLEPLARAALGAGFDVSFFVTGMHMMARYGLTKLEVQRMAGVRVHEFLNQRPGDPQDMVLAKTVMGFSDFITEMKPDLIITHGDRVEALACTLVAATNYIRCGHVEGGEVSGTIDEIFRHCNTKLASAHFVSSDAAARRVMALGEPASAVYVIGSPELDFHSAPSGVSIAEVRARYGIAFEDYGICVFHPVTSEQATMGAQARDLFGALEASGRNFVIIAPNNDPGSEDIFSVINALPKERFRLIPSMRFAHFSELMKNAACMVGNSSAGVREAPFLGVASLDIGTRQHNRADAVSISVADAGDGAAIARFLDGEWGKPYARDEGFGSGAAAARFADVLNDPAFWARGLQKAFHDHG
ncbi:UDP-N-acetylglucosamine 2-epimerase (hydrolysing) [Pseudorhodobacter antarcticus]|jgi:UDP-N-acetylglucosamine 2-epimerase (hydrolysing)|uniref:UDP-N-acetylglucosamine 2-epimerase (Hydrolysing) n=1 Tax=Pseudorhodobacter antarcticus TaxID=1077947 RepID=A0A1H8BSU3_9RHOB|nr:UDP-N-acetylglucosamine 2-epimerase [Pseudorhodobacter antarcticus]SEM85822.1 UDP-N-acetylglucosamine 2-epimerase (hydrolysing) [Pseudorhodobacter antarcticus]